MFNVEFSLKIFKAVFNYATISRPKKAILDQTVVKADSKIDFRCSVESIWNINY